MIYWDVLSLRKLTEIKMVLPFSGVRPVQENLSLDSTLSVDQVCPSLPLRPSVAPKLKSQLSERFSPFACLIGYSPTS